MIERTFTVEGEPIAKGRPRCMCTSPRHPYEAQVPRLRTDPKTKGQEQVVAWTYKDQHGSEEPFTGAVAITLDFYEGKRQKEKFQDADNLTKLVLDALNMIAWVDDRQVEFIMVQVHRNTMDPRTEVVIRGEFQSSD